MLLLRAVVTGFGLTLGAALFKKHVAHRLGLEEKPADKKDEPRETPAEQPGMPPGQVR